MSYRLLEIEISIHVTEPKLRAWSKTALIKVQLSHRWAMTARDANQDFVFTLGLWSMPPLMEIGLDVNSGKNNKLFP